METQYFPNCSVQAETGGKGRRGVRRQGENRLLPAGGAPPPPFCLLQHHRVGGPHMLGLEIVGNIGLLHMRLDVLEKCSQQLPRRWGVGSCGSLAGFLHLGMCLWRGGRAEAPAPDKTQHRCGGGKGVHTACSGAPSRKGAKMLCVAPPSGKKVKAMVPSAARRSAGHPNESHGYKKTSGILPRSSSRRGDLRWASPRACSWR